MKLQLKKEGEKFLLELPVQAALQLQSSELEIYYLRPGMLLLCTEYAKNETFSQNNSHIRPPVQTSIPPEEQAVINKMSRIRFFERNEENVSKALNEDEKKILESLLDKKVVSLFKSQRYPNGVYNISNKIYFGSKPSVATAVSSAQFIQNQGFSPPVQPASNFGSIPSGPALAINTVEHLKKLGYMVLSNEGEAKYQMEKIKAEIKDDEVKGVRGFDKKYYVLRKKFLREFEQPIFDLLDSGETKAESMGSKLNLSNEAVTVILMVMADEGLVIEKRRGDWAKA